MSSHAAQNADEPLARPDENIRVGAYGWLQPSWRGTFYPDDLPNDWMLSYYSNELNTVLVPSDYWQEGSGFGCESWLQDVNEDFSFFVECPGQLLVNEADQEDQSSDFSVFIQQLTSLQSHLSGVVITGLLSEHSISNPIIIARLQTITRLTALFSYTEFPDVPCQSIWLSDAGGEGKGRASFTSLSAPLAVFYDDLRYLRETRLRIERFASQVKGSGNTVGGISPPVIIVKHPSLKTADLIKFRSLVEIMGL